MLKHLRRTVLPIAVICMWVVGTGLYGQGQSVRVQELKNSSLDSFEQGHYRSALEGFRALSESEEKDPMNCYYAGRCLVELNEDLDDAIELLYSASIKQAPADVQYYLGMAYMRHYNFRDAQRCFEKFEMYASRQEKKEYNVKHLIGTCRSAREITSSYNPYEVMHVTFMDLSDSLQFSQVKMKGGQLGRKPLAYFRDGEDPDGLSSLMFSPKAPARGDYQYFSGYAKNEKEGAQIFRVRKGSGQNWGDPEEVSSLNSPGNEFFPYFDPIENDMYFASDGRFGIGGLDLYRSHYDLERDQWTEPVNLGFPVNSVMDEYLLLPGSDLGMVLFFSTRQGTDSTVTVYRVHLVEPRKKTISEDNKMLREIAQLGGAADEILAEMKDIVPAKPVVKAPVEMRPEPADEPMSSYHETLAIALGHQTISDSLKDLSRDARRRVKESDDPNDRWVWQKQIMLWEKRARDEEALADQLYAKMEEDRSVRPEAPAVNPPETIVVDRKVDGLTVYRYAEPEQEISGEPGTQPSHISELPPSSVINRFDILGSSPYSRANPIPMDVALPSGTFYRIQLGAFGAPVEPDAFGGISPVTGEHLRERGMIKYYAGKFSKYKHASQALPRVRTAGYEDAFIVAWYNSTPVSTQKAKQLE